VSRRTVPGTVYLLHLDPPYRHAKHYLGFAENGRLEVRLAEHASGGGARLLAVAAASGSTWRLVRVWASTRALERRIKNTRHVPHYCPECQPQRSAARRQARASAQPAPKDATMTTTENEPIRGTEPASRGPGCNNPGWELGEEITRASRRAEDWERGRDAQTVTFDHSARDGFQDAARTVSAQYAAGVGLDVIAAHHDDVSARLLSDAQTPPGRAYAAEYADTARTLVADLRQDAAVADGRSASACTKPQGTPHPDPRLAARGWQVDSGIYQRTGHAMADREAG
jgi:hypothetical protein